MAEQSHRAKNTIHPIEIYRTALGGWSECKGNKESTHVILTNEDYEELKNRIKQASDHADKIEKDKNREIDDLKAQYHRQMNNLKSKANADIKQANDNAAQWKREAEKQSGLNANLLRISKERANAQRGLQPKKQRTGYRFSGRIAQVNIPSGYSYKDKNKPKQVQVWTTTLQTPYDGTIPLDQIKDHITEDLKTKILGLLNLRYFVSGNTENLWKGDFAQLKDSDINANENYLFNYKFLINPKDKLWEVQIFTTKEIPLVEI